MITANLVLTDKCGAKTYMYPKNTELNVKLEKNHWKYIPPGFRNLEKTAPISNLYEVETILMDTLDYITRRVRRYNAHVPIFRYNGSFEHASDTKVGIIEGKDDVPIFIVKYVKDIPFGGFQDASFQGDVKFNPYLTIVAAIDEKDLLYKPYEQLPGVFLHEIAHLWGLPHIKEKSVMGDKNDPSNSKFFFKDLLAIWQMPHISKRLRIC